MFVALFARTGFVPASGSKFSANLLSATLEITCGSPGSVSVP